MLTAFLLTLTVPVQRSLKGKIEPPPVIIQLQNIPETRQEVRKPAAQKLFIPSAAPIESDELPPEKNTIEDTILDIKTAPESAAPAVILPVVQAAETEKQIYDYYEVEVIPRRLVNVVPEYPEMARRAGLTGSVTLKILINTKGAVDSVEVLEGPAVFRKSAIEAAKATTFSPAKYNDRTVSCWVILPYRFVIE